MQRGNNYNLKYSISSNDNISMYSNFFEKQMENGLSIIDSIKVTIELASKIDPSISKEYEIIKIK